MTIRTLLLFGFLIAMPLFAIPPVADWMESQLAKAPALIGEWATLAHDAAGLSATDRMQQDFPPVEADRDPPPDAVTSNTIPSPPGVETAKRSPADPDSSTNTDRSGQESRRMLVRDQLKRLGARNFVLEAAANGNCRVLCDVPLASNSVYSKPFEAIAEDELSALLRVESAIAAWHRASARRSSERAPGSPDDGRPSPSRGRSSHDGEQ